MKWLCGQHRVRSSLAQVALGLGFLSLLTADALAQGEPRYHEKWPAIGYNRAADLPAWRKITLGTRKGVDAYRDALDAASIKVGDAADEILGRPAFPYASTKTDVELALLSVAELGVEAESEPLSEIYERARQVGLQLCPGEVGPQLRLHYRNQPLGEVLHVAMRPVATYDGRLTILALTNFGGTISLIGSDGRPDFMVPRTFRFVFALPAEGRLEAMRGAR